MSQGLFIKENMILIGLVKKYNRFILKLFFIFFIIFLLFFLNSCNKKDDENESFIKNKLIFDYINDIKNSDKKFKLIYLVSNLKSIYDIKYIEESIYKGILNCKITYNFDLQIVETGNDTLQKDNSSLEILKNILSFIEEDKLNILVFINLFLSSEVLEFLSTHSNILIIDIITNKIYKDRLNIEEYEKIKKIKINNLSIIYLNYEYFGLISDLLIENILNNNFILKVEDYKGKQYQFNFLFLKNNNLNREFYKGLIFSKKSSLINYSSKIYEFEFDKSEKDNLKNFSNLNLYNDKKIFINFVSEKYLMDKVINYSINLNLKNSFFIPLFNERIDELKKDYILFMVKYDFINIFTKLFEKIFNLKIETFFDLRSSNYFYIYFNKKNMIFSVDNEKEFLKVFYNDLNFKLENYFNNLEDNEINKLLEKYFYFNEN